MDSLTEEKFNSSFAALTQAKIQYDDLIKHVGFCNEIGRPFEAYRAWRIWCSQNPRDSSGWANAAITATNAGIRDEAVFCAIELLKIDPNDQQSEFKALSLIMISATFVSILDQARINATSEIYTNRLRRDQRLSQISVFTAPQAISRNRRVRIGYLWESFAKGTEFCFPFHHDRDRFEIVAVTPGAAPCPAEKIGVDRFIEFPIDDLLGAVRMIRAAELDVLIDLNGRGISNYADLIVEARTAPFQAIFGNFFCSVYSPSIDALIGDQAILDVIGDQKHTERLIPIRETMMFVRNPFLRAHDDKINVPPRRYKYRIGSPGNHLKLSPDFLKLLAEVMTAIPDSSFFFSYLPDSDSISYIKYVLTSMNVNIDRIELFMQNDMDYYSMINEIDVAIDSIPYNGHLSTYEFLAHGTPLWSLRGPRMTQRYGQMLIGHVGMPHRVFDSSQALVADLAKNIQVKTPDEANRLKRRVLESGLGDPARATRLFEGAIEALISGQE